MLCKSGTMESTNPVAITTQSLVQGMNSVTVTLPADIGSGSYPVLTLNIKIPSGGYVALVAAKVEIGTKQTLANEILNEWRLNEIPNKVLELVKCSGAPSDIGGQGIIITPAELGLSTANTLVETEVM